MAAVVKLSTQAMIFSFMYYLICLEDDYIRILLQNTIYSFSGPRCFGTMGCNANVVKSKNHTTHNQSQKWHRNDIKKPQTQRSESLTKVNPKFLRNMHFARSTRAWRSCSPTSRLWVHLLELLKRMSSLRKLSPQTQRVSATTWCLIYTAHPKLTLPRVLGSPSQRPTQKPRPSLKSRPRPRPKHRTRLKSKPSLRPRQKPSPKSRS